MRARVCVRVCVCACVCVCVHACSFACLNTDFGAADGVVFTRRRTQSDRLHRRAADFAVGTRWPAGALCACACVSVRVRVRVCVRACVRACARMFASPWRRGRFCGASEAQKCGGLPRRSAPVADVQMICDAAALAPLAHAAAGALDRWLSSVDSTAKAALSFRHCCGRRSTGCCWWAT